MTSRRDCHTYRGASSQTSAAAMTGSVEFVRPKPGLPQYRPEQTGSDDLTRVHRHRDPTRPRRVRQVHMAAARPSDGVTQAFEPLYQLPRGQPRQAIHPATSTATW